MKILIILALLAIPVSAQTPTPDYDAILKRLTEQVESLEKKVEESQKALDESLKIERMAREAGVTIPRNYYNPRPYYPSSRYYPSRYYRSYHPSYPHPRPFRGIYRNYHLW